MKLGGFYGKQDINSDSDSNYTECLSPCNYRSAHHASRPIMPNDECVKYYCPNCGYVLIWRCESCREFARVYKCVGCGFEGP